MTPDEHEAQRRTVWIEAMKAAMSFPGKLVSPIDELADYALARFDARFPAPTKSEDEG